MIYILYAPSRPFRYKIGITNDLKQRVAYIKWSEGIDIKPLACFNIKKSRYYEKKLHRFYRPLKCNSFKGSGKEEWFWLIFPVFPLIFLFLVRFWYFFLLFLIIIIKKFGFY